MTSVPSQKKWHAQFRWPKGAGAMPGRACVARMDELQEDADFWERWMDRLHPDERRALADGEIGVIKRPLRPEWPVGVEMEVASNFWITPEEPKFTHRGWRIGFSARDFRVRIPRQTPGMFEPPELDSQGYPIPTTIDAIKAATEDGNYTPAQELAVPDTDEAVPREYDNVIQMQSRERTIDFKRQERAEQEAREQARRLGATIRDTMLMLARNGGDLDAYVAGLARAAKVPLEDREAA